MKKKLLSLLCVLSITFTLIPQFKVYAMWNAVVAQEYAGLSADTRGNCVAMARYLVPSLPSGLWSLADKQAIIQGYTPKVGAIAIGHSYYKYPNYKYGHVSYVEKINSDGTLTTIDGGCDGTCKRITSTPYEMGIEGYWYPDGSGNSSAPVHTHNWGYGYESSHPHRQYRTCSCGAKEYTGGTQCVGNCTSCYPLGYASLTREHDRIAKTATFYRNNVSNADSYEVILRKDGREYDRFLMNGTSRTVLNLEAGTYTATLTVKNTNTGQTKTSTCSSFTIVESYPVYYNANGGTNAPLQQTKVKDANLTITSSKPTREHYIFKGWASSKTATEPQYKSGEYYTKNTSITLYAVWEPEIYTIDFNPNGGEGETVSTKITYGNKMKMPNDVTYKGFYLKGWSKNQNSQTAEYRIGVDYGFDRNTPLYAVWGQSTWGNEVASSFAGGDGTEKNPYQISNAAELAYLAKTVNEQSSAPEYKYYILTDNIGLGYDEWTPIGLFDYENQYFYGSFDGNGYTISDLGISQVNAGNIGLFGCAKDSEIKNLTLLGETANITSTAAMNIGELVGFAENTNIIDCTAKYVNIANISASDTDYSNIGCVAGKTNGGEIKGCMADESTVFVKSGSFNMGIICGLSGSNLTDCSVKSTADLFGTTGSAIKNVYMGGLCGQQAKDIEKCTVNAGKLSANDISVTNSSYVGGLVGKVSGNVNLCTVKFTDDTQKTIEGENYPLSMSVSSGNSYVGGIAGNFTETAKIKDCMYNGKSISSDASTSNSRVGGLVGGAQAKTPKTVSAQGGQSLSRSELPKRDGYKATWYTDANLTKEYDFSQPVTADMTLYAKWTEGDTDTPIWDGTSSEPKYNAETKTYTVTNGQELAWVSDVTNGVITSGTNVPADRTFEGYTIEIANDIYLNDISNVNNWATTPPKNSWKPIRNFKGNFKGNTYEIKGIYYNDISKKEIGFFKTLNGNAIIENVILANGYINAKENVGGFVGEISSYYSNIKMINCSNKIKVNATGSYCGGIVGNGNSGDIEKCYNSGTITSSGSWSLGGIIGDSNCNISKCYNSGTIKISGDSYVSGLGGIAGSVHGSTSQPKTISKCINTGYISGSMKTGGIVGSFSFGTVIDCYNLGNVNAVKNASTGGIVGYMSQTDNSASPLVTKCYNNASSISGNTDVGGIIGSAYGGTISYCYNSGSVTGNYYTGGLFGTIGATAFGSNSDNLSYYNQSIRYSYTSQSPWYGMASNSHYSTSSVSYKSSSAMKNLSNLTGFSTSDWSTNSSINNGYPYLKELENTYKTYKITAITDPEDSSAINRSFANIDGMLFSNAKYNSYAGGIIGYGYGTKSDAKNLLSVSNKISSKTSNSSNTAYSGDIIGYNNNSAFNLDTIFSNSSLSLSAVNTANSANAKTDTLGIPKNEVQLKRASELKRIFGPDTYQSLDYLKEHPEAVWVVKDGELPELYYNVLRDITLDKVENGTISVDKTQAVDGEKVTVKATPAENYQLNKIYVNGEIAGDTFVVSGDSKVYATFTEKTPKYTAKVEANNNAAASLVDVDSTSEVSLMSVDDTISAEDGNEIKVNTEADTDYAVEAVYVNGEELTSDSFIITEDSVVTLDTVNISTEIKAVTNDAESIGNYFALLSGSVEDVDGAERYIRYWAADNPNEIYTTEVQEGGGDYSFEVTNLTPETTYYYQMTETGEVKSFATERVPMSDIGSADFSGEDNPTEPPEPEETQQPSETEQPIKTDEPVVVPETMPFKIQNAAVSDKVTADIVNISDTEQSGIVIFAAYTNDGKLVLAKYQNIDNIAANDTLLCEFDIPERAEKYKLLVWNSWKHIIPLAESVEVK